MAGLRAEMQILAGVGALLLAFLTLVPVACSLEIGRPQVVRQKAPAHRPGIIQDEHEVRLDLATQVQRNLRRHEGRQGALTDASGQQTGDHNPYRK
ncbi:hypothetical protein D9M68_466930 [compost metagenome]